MTADLASSSTETLPAAQDAVALRQVFASLTAESCPLTYNFHMHTTHSDGQLHPEALAQQAIDLSLKGFAITDHHQISGYRTAQSYMQAQSGTDLPHLWTGTEITSRLLETEVHILGFAFDPDHCAIASYLQGSAPQGDRAQAARVIRAIHQAGGLAVLAHPARYRRSANELIPAAAMVGIDGVETFYAYNNPKPWMPSPKETTRVTELKTELGLLSSCGTDTHGMSLLQRL
ncbi:PHP domain-containing protein [Leptolyngbya sp. NIES-2104]|uniref:PHP domain-containing protein n=1 Tax=Leptolyngbya sp. NIES-2104 TaxID=1552121 RepID=UPI0006EC833C|nr:PHP domain-containing protein [Leptolyngbya sp. NIES-2104]GAP95811.1 PHP family metal-dependent phosphoesterase [Leptolyngbya sp. NIES-2104]